jgi:hypothetical protein
MGFVLGNFNFITVGGFMIVGASAIVGGPSIVSKDFQTNLCCGF